MKHDLNIFMNQKIEIFTLHYYIHTHAELNNYTSGRGLSAEKVEI